MPMPERSSAPLSAADVLAALQVGGAPLQRLPLGPGDLALLRLECDQRELLALVFDYTRHQGSIGVQEADQLVQALDQARRERLPLLLLLETSGIRVTDETAGIASLRRVLRAALDARLDGVRLLALVLRSAFGGASLLACLCERRVLHAGCLLAMSGPRLIEQAVGSKVFDAGDRAAVMQLIGGAARAAVSPGFELVPAEAAAYRDALVRWLAAPAPPVLDLPGLAARAAALEARLPAPQWQAGAAEVTASAVPGQAGQRVLVLASPAGTGAAAALALARALLAPALAGVRGLRTVIAVDAQSHAATPDDEAVLLSECLAHLALAIRLLHRAGERVEVVVTRSGGGGIQGALGGGASRVTMAPGSRLYVLPQAAMQALNKAEDAAAGTLEAALRVGAVDGGCDAPLLPQIGSLNVLA